VISYRLVKKEDNRRNAKEQDDESDDLAIPVGSGYEHRSSIYRMGASINYETSS
jgi:hypothetical protein